MITTGAAKDVVAGRKLIKASFDLKTYEPDSSAYPDVFAKYKAFMKTVKVQTAKEAV